MKVLAVSAHADDETLGCGGTLLRHRAEGDRLSWLTVTARHTPRWSPAHLERRAIQLANVEAAYSFDHITHLGHRDSELDRVGLANLIAEVDQVIAEIRPDVVYVVHRGDVHTDHQTAHRAVMGSLKAFRMLDLGVRQILAYETLSSTDAAAPHCGHAFAPTTFHDVSNFMDEKCRIFGLYDTEVQSGWKPRSESALRALARMRGATIGVEHAESFMLLRAIR